MSETKHKCVRCRTTPVNHVGILCHVCHATLREANLSSTLTIHERWKRFKAKHVRTINQPKRTQ